MSISRKFLMLVGGGPAPGIASVQEFALRELLHKKYEVFAINGGFKFLKAADPNVLANNMLCVKEEHISGLSDRGGSLVSSHRTSLIGNPADEISSPALDAARCLQKLGFTDILAIGGDDTGSSTARLIQAAHSISYELRGVHFDKTIDDDLGSIPDEFHTFGADTAAGMAAEQLACLSREIEFNPERIFILEVMGRACGRPAINAAKKAKELGHPVDWLLVIEQLGHITWETYSRVLVGGILKARVQGRFGGVALVSEGNADRVLDYESGGARDDYGHQSLSRASFVEDTAKKLEQMLLEISAKNTDLGGVSVTALKLGYGHMRCAKPSDFDLEYCTAIGREGARRLIDGTSGVTFYYKGAGEVAQVGLVENIQPSTKRVPTRSAKLEALKSIYSGSEIPFLTTADMSESAFVNKLEAVSSLSTSELRSYFEDAASVMDSTVMALGGAEA